VFEDSLQAIASPPTETVLAKTLTAVLNSRLAAWFYFHESANLGTDRAKVVQSELLKLPFSPPGDMPNPGEATEYAQKISALIDEELDAVTQPMRAISNVLEQLDKLVYGYYGLSATDIAIIEDCFDYTIPAMQPRRSAGLLKIWARCQEEQRRQYASDLCFSLKSWFGAEPYASLAAKSADVAILRLSLDDSGVARSEYNEGNAVNVDDLLSSICANMNIVLPGNFHLVPDLRLVIGTDMYLVKPLQLRFWLRSAAQADAEQIAAEFQALLARTAGNGEVHCARG